MTAVEPRAPKKPKRFRSRKYPSTPLVGTISQDDLGPAMRALNARQQRFVYELALGPSGYGSEIRAIRAAGHSGTAGAAKVLAHQTLHNPRVQEALREVGYKMVRAASFASIKNVQAIANDLEHHDCLKANLALLDRGGFAIETIHSVKVEHKHNVAIDTEKALERIRELAAMAGVKALPPMIDATAKEVGDGE
jgi:hypothetical protein